MSKRKLTQNQTRRIQSNNAKALHRHKKKEVEWQDDMLGESQDGVVVTRYSVHADVENAHAATTALIESASCLVYLITAGIICLLATSIIVLASILIAFE